MSSVASEPYRYSEGQTTRAQVRAALGLLRGGRPAGSGCEQVFSRATGGPMQARPLLTLTLASKPHALPCQAPAEPSPCLP